MIDLLNTGKPYEHAFIYFDNHTNNTMRIKCKFKATFIRFGMKKNVEKTIIVKPQQTGSIYLAEFEASMAHQGTIILLSDFELINYAIQPMNYETEW